MWKQEEVLGCRLCQREWVPWQLAQEQLRWSSLLCHPETSTCLVRLRLPFLSARIPHFCTPPSPAPLTLPAPPPKAVLTGGTIQVNRLDKVLVAQACCCGKGKASSKENVIPRRWEQAQSKGGKLH